MRVVFLEVPESFLAERRRLGADTRDEMWKGVLHMVPQPTSWHQVIGTQLIVALAPAAKAKGIECAYDIAFYRADDDYRVPDVSFQRSQRTKRGIEGGAEFVIEILTPGDETYEKLPWYADFPVREVLVIEPESRRVELFVLRGGKLYPVAPDENGRVRATTLGTAFATVTTPEGPRLEVSGVPGAAQPARI